jgi:hypothetical protein
MYQLGERGPGWHQRGQASPGDADADVPPEQMRSVCGADALADAHYFDRLAP